MQFIGDLLDLAMPQNCAGCGAKSDNRSVLVCSLCTTMLTGCAHRVRLKAPPLRDFPIVASARYEGAARNILLAAKERGQVALIPMIAKATAVSMASLLADTKSSQALALVPVPSMQKNLRTRGYNLVAETADLVARDLAMRFDEVRVVPILRHARRVDDQSRLTAKARALNLRGAFTTVDGYVPALINRQVIIVDDLVTTGSTLIEARRALVAVGVSVFGAACAMDSY
jgi:ComF family protein